jgi:hypothetical protein
VTISPKSELHKVFDDLAEYGRRWRETEATAWEVALYPEVADDGDQAEAGAAAEGGDNE